MSYYAVRTGRKPGIYSTWAICQANVKNYSNACFKRFKDLESAKRFMNNDIATCKPGITDEQFTKQTRDQFPNRVHIYIDGSSLNNGAVKSDSGIGIYFPHDDSLSFSGPSNFNTNNQAEIEAACLAVEIARRKRLGPILLITDSTYVISSVTNWIKKWRSNGWINSTGSDVRNRDLITFLSQLIETVDIKWKHVAGHKGISGNETADVYAGRGALSAKEYKGCGITDKDKWYQSLIDNNIIC